MTSLTWNPIPISSKRSLLELAVPARQLDRLLRSGRPSQTPGHASHITTSVSRHDDSPRFSEAAGEACRLPEAQTFR